jgi:hypothetical protein
MIVLQFGIPSNKTLHRMDYLYTLLKFVVGGSVIAGVTLLAENVDPRYGSMLAAAPITFSETGRETIYHLPPPRRHTSLHQTASFFIPSSEKKFASYWCSGRVCGYPMG